MGTGATPEREPASAANLSPLRASSASKDFTFAEADPPPVIPDHELICRIGQGSYGEVWMARNVLGTLRAVKIVYRRNFANDRPFEREFKGIQKFEPVSRSHESQVDILHIGRDEECFYYVMELADDAGTIGHGTPGWESPSPGAAVRNTGPAPLPMPLSYVPRTLKSEKQQRGRLPFSECLEIGLALTTALAHLHKNGLVHRDVKPSNVIFVGGVPKLADIGLVTDTDDTVSFVGTEGFIPPEGPGSPQADIYGLGKVLYELSTGKDRLDYPEPATHLGEFTDHDQLLELGLIINKACARDLKERYQTAEAMQADLLLLKTGKSVRRNHQLEQRVRLLTRVGAVTVAIMLLGVVPYFLAIREARSAKREAARSRQIARVLEHMFSGIQPLVSRGRDTTLLLELLDQTAARLPFDLKEQPGVEADLRMILATSYQQVGNKSNALAMAREALRLREGRDGAQSVGVGDAWALIGVLEFDQSNFAGAEAAARQALGIRSRVLGSDHTNVATSLNNAGLAAFFQGKFSEAEKLHQDALAKRIKAFGPDDLEVGKSLNNLAMVSLMTGKQSAAEEQYQKALAIFEAKLPANDLRTALVMNNIGNLKHRKGELAEAERLHARVVDIRSAAYGFLDSEVARSATNFLHTVNEVADARQARGEELAADSLRRLAAEIKGRVFLRGHQDVAGSLTQLARVRAARGDFARAEKMFRDALVMQEDLGLGDHMLVADALAGLAGVLCQRGEFQQAEPMLERAFRIRQKVFGPYSSDAADVLNSQGMLAALKGDFQRAEELFDRALVMTRNSVGLDHHELVPAIWLCNWARQQQGRGQADGSVEAEVGNLIQKHGAYALSTLTASMYDLAGGLQLQGRWAEAEAILRQAHNYLQWNRVSPILLRDNTERLARFYEQWNASEHHGDRAELASTWKQKLTQFDGEHEIPGLAAPQKGVP